MDRYRKEQTRERAEAARSQEWEELVPSHAEHSELCKCLKGLLPLIRNEYAELLQMVDLDGIPMKEAAAALTITVNNATVRLHRARKALLTQVQNSCRTCASHGCLDCTCKQKDEP
jgi:RNA polymerase sigma-70 factor (ECF subfamily)